MIVTKFAAALLLAYLVGAIPVGLMVGRLVRGVDVREYGSGKIGATNVLRTAGVGAGTAVLVGDVLKGVLAVILAGLIMGGGRFYVGGIEVGARLAQGLALLAAVVGHNWPVYVRFKGGRGTAVLAGGGLVLAWWATLICVFIFGLVIYVSRWVSLGSISGAFCGIVLLIILAFFGLRPWEYAISIALSSALVIGAHWDNIVRLVQGKERKLGQRAERRT
ncbi:MAG TPA: glycerol-3-phosphate 1-O-acyltransferase PlsY [Dehalococcoidia bacterium]|nr:glycerol-3-phosphate 1-O-acyltransferase PlsY [Dehalococcoidia bacterium]